MEITKIMTYGERLHHWAVVRLMPDLRWLVIARYRQRVDADGHLKFLQRQLPKQVFRVVFDCEHRQVLEELGD